MMVRDLLTSPVWSDLIVAACAIGLLACLLFAIQDHRLTGGHWRDSREGRWLMWRSALLASIFALVLVNRIFGDWIGRLPLTFALMALYVLQTFTPYRLLMQAQREAREARERKAHAEQEDGSEDTSRDVDSVPR